MGPDNSLLVRPVSRRRRGQRGFSLIELGIVVAVIAILATVVLVGRGFLESSRVSKMVEVIDTISKGLAVYSGTNGGEIPTSYPSGSLLGELEARQLVITNVANSVPNYSITNVTATGTENYQIVVTCPNAQACEDIKNAKIRDASNTAPPAASGTQVTLNMRL